MASVINQIKLGNTEYAIAASAYAECSTAAGTPAKVATICTDSDTTNTAFTLIKGVSVQVKFSNTNSASNPTLNVNSTGAKSIYYKGVAITASYLKANHIYTFVYDGIQWNLVGEINTDTNTQRAYYTSNPAMNGTASAGSSAAVSRGDHVHPTDLSRAASTHTHGNIANDGTLGTASRVVVTDTNKKVTTSSSITTTELGYLDGVTSNIQTQLNNKIETDDNGRITVKGMQHYSLSLFAEDGSVDITADDSTGMQSSVHLGSEHISISKEEPVNDEDSSHIMMYNDQLDISVRGQANTTEDYDSEITSGISISSHQVTIGDINAADNDPEYDQMEVNIDANRVNLNATYARVNQAKIMTADDFEYDSSTGYLVINTAWKV